MVGHWMHKLTKEERTHYAKYIKSKEGLRKNIELAQSRNMTLFEQCYECYIIAKKLRWAD